MNETDKLVLKEQQREYITRRVEDLSAEEKRVSMMIHQTHFNSDHEAYAIIKEETEETFDAMLELHTRLDELWDALKANLYDEALLMYDSMRESAKDVAMDAISVMAMCTKALDSREEKNHE